MFSWRVNPFNHYETLIFILVMLLALSLLCCCYSIPAFFWKILAEYILYDLNF